MDLLWTLAHRLPLQLLLIYNKRFFYCCHQPLDSQVVAPRKNLVSPYNQNGWGSLWGVSSIGRALPLQGRGYRLEPGTLHGRSVTATQLFLYRSRTAILQSAADPFGCWQDSYRSTFLSEKSRATSDSTNWARESGHELVAPALIAHAGGAVAGCNGTNALEALDNSYRRGHRYIEMDF